MNREPIVLPKTRDPADPPKRVDLAKLERRRIPAAVLVAGVVLGNALFHFSPYPDARYASLAVYNLVIVVLGIYFRRYGVVAAGLAGALLAGPLTGALAG